MSQPPPPQYSPDGKFWWNGQEWLAVVAPAVVKKSHLRRNLVIGGLIFAGLLVWGGISSLANLGQPTSHKADITVKLPAQVKQGDSEDMVVTVNSKGQDIGDLSIYFPTHDNMLDHTSFDSATLSNAGSCSRPSSQELRCGSFASGTSVTVTISMTAYDAGTYTYAPRFRDMKDDKPIELADSSGKAFNFSFTQTVVKSQPPPTKAPSPMAKPTSSSYYLSMTVDNVSIYFATHSQSRREILLGQNGKNGVTVENVAGIPSAGSPHIVCIGPPGASDVDSVSVWSTGSTLSNRAADSFCVSAQWK